MRMAAILAPPDRAMASAPGNDLTTGYFAGWRAELGRKSWVS